MMAEMSSVEWNERLALIEMDAEYQQALAKKVDPKLAFEGVYGIPKD